ncbi:TraA family conjugative transfer protein [Thioalkalivibrio sp. ALMg11]|uniref:TraA family conjugative transfer protein n=1 Tax=Thioalkalivibrio sp. ALMg11 TaxID=1158165 RepID=UPI00036AEEE7|nr:TraA family conjugative transfer protein [Thioalkalivibrio sp. ALMg11]
MNAIRSAIRYADNVSMKAATAVDSNHKSLLLMLLVMTAIYASAAVAGTSGGEFQGIYDQVKGWTEGYLGKAIALFAFLLGLGVGVARQSPIPAISGVVFALFVAFGPDIIEGIASAVI